MSGDTEPQARGPHVERDVEVERLELGGGAWVDVARGWLAEPDELYADLLESVAWQTSRLFRYDHFVEERRLGSSWRRGSPLPHPALAEATRTLQHRYRVEFDGFGMIQYRDGRDGQAFHRDTDMRWLDDTVIAILSLGAQRPWLLRPVRAASTTRRARAPPTTWPPPRVTSWSWAVAARPTGSIRCRTSRRGRSRPASRSSGASPTGGADRSWAPHTGRRSPTAGADGPTVRSKAGSAAGSRCR